MHKLEQMSNRFHYHITITLPHFDTNRQIKSISENFLGTQNLFTIITHCFVIIPNVSKQKWGVRLDIFEGINCMTPFDVLEKLLLDFINNLHSIFTKEYIIVENLHTGDLHMLNPEKLPTYAV